MAERNNVEYLMKPQTPKLTPDEVRYVYIPRASYNTPGLASFGSMHFVVSPEGNVVLNPLFVKRIEDLEAIPVYKGEGDMSIILNSKANSSTGLRSSAGGYKSKVSGDAAFGHGLDIEVSGRSATGFGERTKVSGIGAGGFGQDNESNGTDSFTSGSKNIANGYCGTSFGNNTKSIGDVSFSEGGNTEARSRYSHAAGLGTIAEAIAQYVIGQYNAIDKNALFVIGNGDSDNARKNALAVYKDKMSVNVPISVVLSMTSDPYNQTTVNINSSGASMRTTYGGHFFDFNYIDGVRVDGLKIQNQGITDIDITHFKEAYDNYLPKRTNANGINEAYVKTGDGGQTVVPIRVGNTRDSLVQRNEYGRAMITSPLYPDEIANKRYVDEEIAKFDFIKIVDVLPETGLENRIYLIPANETQNLDLFDEYIWINDAWEFLGVKQFEIELEPYAKKTYVDDLTHVNVTQLDLMLQEVLV